MKLKSTRTLHAVSRTKWFFLEIDEDSASNGVGYAERRRGEIVGPRVRIDTTLKVPVSTEYPHGNQVSLFYGCSDLLWQWSTVTNTCHTAVAYQVETESLGERERGMEEGRE